MPSRWSSRSIVRLSTLLYLNNLTPSRLRLLAAAPGMPIEWCYAAGQLTGFEQKLFRRDVEKIDPREAEVMVDMIEPGDGREMLAMVCPRYRGPAPIWSKLDLLADPRSAAAIARLWAVPDKRVIKWRTQNVFCPLTLVRLTPRRGRPLKQ